MQSYIKKRETDAAEDEKMTICKSIFAASRQLAVNHGGKGELPRAAMRTPWRRRPRPTKLRPRRNKRQDISQFVPCCKSPWHTVGCNTRHLDRRNSLHKTAKRVVPQRRTTRLASPGWALHIATRAMSHYFTMRTAQPKPPYMAKALKPPSTTATVPVTNLAASLIR